MIFSHIWEKGEFSNNCVILTKPLAILQPQTSIKKWGQKTSAIFPLMITWYKITFKLLLAQRLDIKLAESALLMAL